MGGLFGWFSGKSARPSLAEGRAPNLTGCRGICIVTECQIPVNFAMAVFALPFYRVKMLYHSHRSLSGTI